MPSYLGRSCDKGSDGAAITTRQRRQLGDALYWPFHTGTLFIKALSQTAGKVIGICSARRFMLLNWKFRATRVLWCNSQVVAFCKKSIDKD